MSIEYILVSNKDWKIFWVIENILVSCFFFCSESVIIVVRGSDFKNKINNNNNCVGGFLFSHELIAEFLIILKLSVMEKKEVKNLIDL